MDTVRTGFDNPAGRIAHAAKEERCRCLLSIGSPLYRWRQTGRTHTTSSVSCTKTRRNWACQRDNLPRGCRVEVDGPGHMISAIRWGTDEPSLVLLHGGGQNAHTWDSLIVWLGSRWPALAVDLPGHGHSAGSVSTDPAQLAYEIGPLLDRHIRKPATVCGMSLGGLVAVVIAATRPHLVSRLILVDVLPGVGGDKAGHILASLNGPSSFDSFEELVARTMAAVPDRTEGELRRGVLHNAVQQPDGTWRWRMAIAIRFRRVDCSRHLVVVARISDDARFP